MKNLYLSLIAALVCAWPISGCKKNNDDSSVIGPYNFTYKGTLCTNNDIVFKGDSNLASLSHLWNFGDGQTSTELMPTHRFADSGTYVVTLTINGGTSKKVSKTLKLLSDPGVTASICHSWLCSHSLLRDIEGINDTMIHYADTSISIGYLDPITVTIGMDTLFYDPSRSTSDKVSYFAFDTYPSYKWLTYYVGDSIKYEKYHHYSAAGGDRTEYVSH